MQAASLRTTGVLFPQGRGYPDVQPRHRLILGDNLAVMAALLPEYEGRFDVIYADPPFFSRQRFKARSGYGEDSRKPHTWQLAEGYADEWPSLDAYLDFLYPRLHLMYRLLAPHGTLYLHLDWHANAYARLLLDEIFGADALLNEIVWVYHGPSPIRSAFNRKHDTILAYVKGREYYFDADAVREPYHPNTVKTFRSSRKAGFGKVPDLKRGKVPEDWWYFPVVARLHNERTGYPTQKPQALLERIIKASSPPDGLVGDFFCGSGTTAVVAARLGRRFVAVDATRRAIFTTQARLAVAGGDAVYLQETARSPEKEALPPDELPRVLWEPDGTSGGRLRLVGESLPPALAYWDVDPAWDGKVFHSVAQAVRPWRQGDIPRECFLRERGAHVRVRFWLLTGESGEICV